MIHDFVHWLFFGNVTMAPASWFGLYVIIHSTGKGVRNIIKFGEAEAAKNEAKKQKPPEKLI